MTERSDQSMEAARNSSSSLDDFVSSSIQRMDIQEDNLNDTARAVQALVAQVSGLTQQLQHLRVPTAPPPPLIPHHHQRTHPSQSLIFRSPSLTQVKQTSVEHF
jgi:hypothetical protein